MEYYLDILPASFTTEDKENTVKIDRNHKMAKCSALYYIVAKNDHH